MFERGFTIFRVRGIPVKLHVSLLVFLPYVAFLSAREFVALAQRANVAVEAYLLPPLGWGLLLALGLFVSIVLHELAHSLVAMRSGVHVQSITLMMLGGVSRLESDVPPAREAWMAFAGPLTSVAIAAAAYAICRLAPLPAGLNLAVFIFAATNAMLGAFNLLPAFPMDGGRVLRGLLTGPLGRDRATRVATFLGKALAIGFGLLGLLTVNVLLILIAGFVFVGATAEQAHLRTRDVLHHLPVRELMTDRVGEALENETTGEVARRLLRQDLVGARVLGDGVTGDGPRRTVGIVTAQDLLQLASRGGSNAPVSASMRTDLPSAHVGDDAGEAVAPLLSGTAPALVVLDGGDAVIGLITLAELDRAMALGSLPGGPGGPGRRS